MRILVLNAGSSSIKFELFRMPEETVDARGLLQRIGEPTGELACRIGPAERKFERPVRDHAEGLRLILDTLTDTAHGGIADLAEIGAVGHRVVHGGEAFHEPVLIDDEVERAIEAHVPLAPLHNPPNLLGIREARRALPGVPQVAVFDTAFHQTMPPVALRAPGAPPPAAPARGAPGGAPRPPPRPGGGGSEGAGVTADWIRATGRKEVASCCSGKCWSRSTGRKGRGRRSISPSSLRTCARATGFRRSTSSRSCAPPSPSRSWRWRR
jgi:hypothetical protein